MQAVGVDSCVFQRSHGGPLFEALVGARAEFIERAQRAREGYLI